MAVALEETFGTVGPIETFSYSGKTDPQIVFELMAMTGLGREAVAPRLRAVFERYLAHLERSLNDDGLGLPSTREPGRIGSGAIQVLPGVVEALDALRQVPGVALGLLTGNIEPGAAIKLSAAGLSGYFDFGAFGSDNEDRNQLVGVARARARERFGEAFPGSLTVVVGDAEADIRCARAGGARAVAVASGWTPRGRLAALEPDVLLDSMAEHGALAALLGAGGASGAAAGGNAR